MLLRRVSGVNDVEVDARRVVHHVGIVFTGEDVAGSAHVGRELIDFIEPAVDHVSHEVRITKIADHEVIGFSLAETWELEIGASDPEAFPLEPPDQMMTDEAARPADQRDFSSRWFRRHLISSRFTLSSQRDRFRRHACTRATFWPRYRTSGETDHPTCRKRSSAPSSALQFLCRRRKRRTVKGNRNRGSHHFEQNLYPSGPVQPLERAHEIGKRAGQDANVLPFDEAGIQAASGCRQIARSAIPRCQREPPNITDYGFTYDEEILEKLDRTLWRCNRRRR